MFDSLFKWEARQSFYKSLGNIKCDKFFNRWNRKKSDKKLIGSSVAGGEYQLQAYIYSFTSHLCIEKENYSERCSSKWEGYLIYGAAGC